MQFSRCVSWYLDTFQPEYGVAGEAGERQQDQREWCAQHVDARRVDVGEERVMGSSGQAAVPAKSRNMEVGRWIRV